MSFNNEIRTSSSILYLIEEQLINFTRPDVVEIRKANKILSQGKPYCVLFEVGSHVDITKDAREASVEPEYYENRIALALLHTNFAMKMLVDFYIRIYKPPVLTKNFSNREKAIQWLKELKKEHHIN